VAVDFLRRRRRRPKVEPPEDLPHPEPGPGQHAEGRQRLERLEAELARWPPKHRYVLLAKEAGVPAIDIARSLETLYGETVLAPTVDARCSKLRTRLAAALKDSL
jgi:DNA-directed RNA polymerase specialized sigma24 family protein